MSDDIEKEIENDDPPTEEVAELMESHDLDKEEAEHVQEIMEEYGLDEDDAVELSEELQKARHKGKQTAKKGLKKAPFALCHH